MDMETKMITITTTEDSRHICCQNKIWWQDEEFCNILQVLKLIGFRNELLSLWPCCFGNNWTYFSSPFFLGYKTWEGDPYKLWISNHWGYNNCWQHLVQCSYILLFCYCAELSDGLQKYFGKFVFISFPKLVYFLKFHSWLCCLVIYALYESSTINSIAHFGLYLKWCFYAQ